MIKEGCLANVDHVVGMHLWTPIKVGNVAVTKYMMASVGHFDVKVIGNGGHGSQPQACVNAINVSAQIILALNTITSCRIDPREMAVLSVGEFNSGLANNVIPETALIKGTTRSFSQEILQNIEKEIRLIANGIAESNGAKCEVGFFYGYPATINDDAIMKIAEQTIDEKIGKEKRIEIKPNLGGEDFSYYLEKIPGVFIFVGAGNDTNAIYGHHNPKFDIDEDSIIIGAKILSDIAIRLL
jgi:amidohydrolase